MRIKTLFFMIISAFSLNACQAIGNFYDNVGSHMPVVGERCEHWQCITSGGQERSRQNKAEREMRAREDVQENAASSSGQAPAVALPPDRKPIPQRATQ